MDAMEKETPQFQTEDEKLAIATASVNAINQVLSYLPEMMERTRWNLQHHDIPLHIKVDLINAVEEELVWKKGIEATIYEWLEKDSFIAERIFRLLRSEGYAKREMQSILSSVSYHMMEKEF